MSRGLEPEIKEQIIQEFQISDKDTGSIEVQVALLTARIKHLTEHLKEHPKDYHSRRGLMTMVGRRRKMLKYLKKNKPLVYQDIVTKLGIRG
ncbi:MAG: 30S ribosomal protein S15 [Defluviitoga tunisiensis]|jgi:small subunit ribosomal protein S15|uniref:Small ribosomal subunit protein uS15 n=1 Tax=Defluviitoga tunisiensis TaxID=1006576 RepID=A0A0C7NJ20_DEFTU|nr:30S ribosomal protein S15 [Defluviitoga tunisiensis]MDD3600316.1 30S ribosomal protein S15 [Defluviitoga tunisiensis]MDY0378920.1 30S ribosomal protein S15 [Defluviitoga tunisiensis]CEP77931.1 30S ribosomal protein S15 [Defluviitoga tunisiensis]HHV01387.1 30S ribosomal protein S15 [Defluviitoga tunisiensis]HOB54997.1 30S ribosomal protein S15 [Defluviitoga tunisiensis]